MRTGRMTVREKRERSMNKDSLHVHLSRAPQEDHEVEPEAMVLDLFQ